jgi:hypothetical protein
LITEGSTTTILPDYGITTQVTVEHPTTLYAKGALMRGMIADKKSPIVYGYTGDQLPIYFSQDPVLRAVGGGGRGGFGGSARQVPGVGVDITPNSTPIALSPYAYPDADEAPGDAKGLPTQDADGAAARAAVRRNGGGGRGGATNEAAEPAPRVVLQFPARADEMLLSGELAGGEALSGRALAVDQPLGAGHVVMFALRPFWRWQTQGTFALGFNTIVNWDHLDAGKSEAGKAEGKPRAGAGAEELQASR